MAIPATIVFALLTVAIGHPDRQEADRRLTWVDDQHIWWGGEPGGNRQCSAHLSDGPTDADVELRLGGLPASTEGEAVHLQWWSARKSPTRYNPLVTPVNCSVHKSVCTAYPKHSDADFNGGNVQVSGSGEAVIRIRAPSTYYMWRHIAIPHIHLRVCKGAAGFQAPSDAIMMSGPDVWVSSARTSPLRIISAHTYAARQAPASESVGGPRPIAVVAGVSRCSSGSSTLPETTTTVPLTSSELGIMIDAARDALDLGALEFSPVYSCLLERKFYDHFSEGCVADCPTQVGPTASTAAHGQCVREETPAPQAKLERSWQLGIQCGTPCWHNRKNVTLHNLRLSFASLLDIPFQEVEISMGFSTSSSRRLSNMQTAYLTVKVNTNRVAVAESDVLLGWFPTDAASMSAHLGLDVRSVSRGDVPSQQRDPATMGPGSDPYGPAYTAIEDGPGKNGPPSSVVGFLPTEAIIGIAAGVVVLAVVAGGLLWRRQRQRRAAAQAQQAKTVDEKVAETEAGSVPEANKPACV